jgi:hypothetical protein
LFRALILCKLIKDRQSSNFTRCGRTDKGVSAMGQVVAFHLRSALETNDEVGMVSDDWKAAEAKGPVPPVPRISGIAASLMTDTNRMTTTTVAAIPPTTISPSVGVETKDSVVPTPTTASPPPSVVGNANQSVTVDDKGRPLSKKERKRAKRLANGGSTANATAALTDKGDKSSGSKGKVKEELDYALLLNGVLPPDIRVLGWAAVPLDFNARFSCVGRTYKYYFFAGNDHRPLLHSYLNCIFLYGCHTYIYRWYELNCNVACGSKARR